MAPSSAIYALFLPRWPFDLPSSPIPTKAQALTFLWPPSPCQNRKDSSSSYLHFVIDWLDAL